MSDVTKAVDATSDMVFGHQPGLFLLFFTEMWERFSYYGMRALLVLFLVSEIAGGGWGWSREKALGLYAMYTGLVYLTPILGGIVADKLLGYRNAVLFGALLMTLGHAALAFETEFMFYAGLWLLIFGNGFFKPNISTMVGQLYANDEEKKDAAYTIFYMGINAGAFLGILLCGFIGEQIGWSYGFGLAGIFMLLGMIMFLLGQSIFGEVGKKGSGGKTAVADNKETEVSGNVVRDRLIVVGILSFFTIFFWMAFEQAGGSLTIFAKDYTGRVLTGNGHWMFLAANTFLTIAPLAIVTWVLWQLVKATNSRIPVSNLSIILSFVIIWAIALYMLFMQFNSKSYEVTFDALDNKSGQVTATGLETGSTLLVREIKEGEETSLVVAGEGAEADGKSTFAATVDGPAEDKAGSFTVSYDVPAVRTRTIPTSEGWEVDQSLFVVDLERKSGNGKLKVISEEQAAEFESKYNAKVVKLKANETEVPASWFGILNSFFIIAFAPLFGKIWASKFSPSAPVKFGIGLVLLGLGFGAVAYASMGIDKGAETASISLWWLVLAYLFHTLGELCVSPVGLSYVSKLAPAKLVGLMFGVWFGCTAVANYLAGWTGSYIDTISEQYGLVTFFLIYTIIPIAAGLAIMLMNKMIKRMMHGIE